jgi:hypothetical protein
MNEISPFLHKCGLPGTITFVHQTENSGLQGERIEACHHWGGGVGNRPLLVRPLITNPAKLPTRTWQRLKGIEGVGRQQASEARPANAPPSVNEHLAFASITREEVGRGLIGPHNFHWRRRFVSANVNDLVLCQGVADRETFNPWPRLDVRGPHAAHARAWVMDSDIRQLEVSFGHSFSFFTLICPLHQAFGKTFSGDELQAGSYFPGGN